MTPCEIVEAAGRDGVTLLRSDDGKGIRLAGDRGAVAEWLPAVRMFKAGLLLWLANNTFTEPSEPERVRCCDCIHFHRDAIGFGHGIGSCKAGQDIYQRALLYPRAQRVCNTWKAVGLKL